MSADDHTVRVLEQILGTTLELKAHLEALKGYVAKEASERDGRPVETVLAEIDELADELYQQSLEKAESIDPAGAARMDRRASPGANSRDTPAPDS